MVIVPFLREGDYDMLLEPQEMKLSNGKTITIRSAAGEDALQLAKHRKITAGETYNMARYPEECDYDIDKAREGLTRTAKDPRDFMVTAFCEGEVVGDLGVLTIRDLMKYRHRGYMGISIRNEYCDQGLGSTMVKIAIDQARKNGFEQVELGVFSDNMRAIHVYEKFGFKQYGINPRAFKLKDGTYRDEVIMVNIFST